MNKKIIGILVMMLLIATAVVTAVSTKNENIYNIIDENIVWDNGMNYDGIGTTQWDETINFDWYGADDVLFVEDTKVCLIRTINGYFDEDYQQAKFNWTFLIYLDRGDGNAPGDIFAGPFNYTHDMCNPVLINDTGSEIYYEFTIELPDTIIFLGGQKYWLSFWGVGALPTFCGAGYHFDPIKLHQGVGKSVYMGYPDWQNIEDVSSEVDFPIDGCFQLLTSSPPTIPVISGPPSGKTGEQQEYTFSSTDPEGSDVKYCIDWGDDTSEVCIGPFPTGDEIKQSHTWDEEGTYTIKVKAQDKFGIESEYGTIEVSMPKAKTFNLRIFLQQFLEKHSYLFSLLQQLLDV